MEVVAKCLGIAVERLDYEPIDEATGADFVSKTDDTLVVGSDAQVVLASQAASDREVLRHPRFAECYGAALKRYLAEDNANPTSKVDMELVAFETVDPPAGATGASRISIDFTRAGARVAAIVFDLVFIVEGRVEATLTFSNAGVKSNLGEPIPAGVAQAMVDQVATKIDRQ
jgi:hypothetical protein